MQNLIYTWKDHEQSFIFIFFQTYNSHSFAFFFWFESLIWTRKDKKENTQEQKKVNWLEFYTRKKKKKETFNLIWLLKIKKEKTQSKQKTKLFEKMYLTLRLRNRRNDNAGPVDTRSLSWPTHEAQRQTRKIGSTAPVFSCEFTWEN